MRRENEKDQALITEVKQKLDWYINDASDKEYDEKAVASLEYLLETLEPTDDFKVDEEKAWVEFKDYVAQREAHGGAKKDKTPKTKKRPAFWSRHKGLVAAAILVLLLAVSIGTSSEAVRDNGFFHWIQNMTGGRKMITVPEDLDSMTKKDQTVKYTDRNSIPDEWKVWSKIEKDVMDKCDADWQYFEVIESADKVLVHSQYDYKNNFIILGALGYVQGNVLEVEIFDRFDRYETWELDGIEFGVGCVKEENRTIYCLEFYDETFKYYIIGAEDILDQMKELVVRYKIMTLE